MKMVLKRIHGEHFKGMTNLTIDFHDGVNRICGRNASGKTTVLDLLTWILFGKDSLDREKFEIRELDKDGNKVHNVDILGEATFDVDGKEITFTKRQRENWVKKRNSEYPVLQGNVNEMMINGYPKSDSEFKKSVSEIVDEDFFKMLTNPAYFPSMAWKDQRNILMKFISENADLDIAKSLGGFDDLIPDLEFASNTDEIAKKYGKSVKDLKEKAKEIPTRIDEVEKSRVYVDVGALENKRVGIENQIAECDRQIANGTVDTSSLEIELAKIGVLIKEYEASADEILREKRSKLKDSLADAEREVKDKKHELATYNDSIINASRKIAEGEARIGELRVEYNEAKRKVMSDNATVCPACGRPFEEDRIEEIKKAFSEERASKMKQIDAEASGIDKQDKDLGADIEKWQEKMSIINRQLDTIYPLIENIEKEIAGLPDTPDYTESAEYVKLIERKDTIEVEMAEKMAQCSDVTSIELHRDELKEQLREIDSEIGKATKNTDIDSRVSELEDEMKDVQQKIADGERMLYLLDQFVKQKMDSVSKAINEQFELCDFKLFEQQINGGIKETCELLIDGVPYNSLNSGHRIVAGLDIIKSLQNLLGCEVPVWVDNSETINSFNIPQMDCQMVLLQVTEDSELMFI